MSINSITLSDEEDQEDARRAAVLHGGEANGLALSDQVWAEQVELESPDDVGDAGLAGFAGREVAG
jgi:hypothetical protein